jgi:hypothetical protein
MTRILEISRRSMQPYARQRKGARPLPRTTRLLRTVKREQTMASEVLDLSYLTTSNK